MNKRNSTIRNIFILSLIIVSSYNLIFIVQKSYKIHEIRKESPFYFSGYKFSGLEKLFKGIEYVGYYTDKDVTLPENNMEYSQAQFILAPTILEINNTGHKYTLFDCSNENVALTKIKQLGLLPLKKNSEGIILTQRIK